MALNISINTPCGFPATYWRLETAEIYTRVQRGRVVFQGYKDEEGYRGGMSSMESRELEFDFASLGGEPTRGNIYQYAKTLPEWEGAEDV